MTATSSAAVRPDVSARPLHVARLRAAAEATGISPAELAARVCDHVLGQQEVAARLAVHPDADELRARMHGYVQSLWGDDHDGRLRTARRDGVPGGDTGLPLDAYLTGFVLIDDVVIDTLVHALADDPDALSIALRAYRRVTTSDLVLHLRGAVAPGGLRPR